MKQMDLNPADALRANALILTQQILGSASGKELCKKLNKKLIADLEGRNLDCSGNLEPVEEGTPEMTLNPRKPIVFRRFAERWPCIQDLTFDNLKRLHGKKQVINIKTNRAETLSEIIAKIHNGESAAVKFDTFIDKFQLENLFDMDWLRGKMPAMSHSQGFHTFIGAKGDATPMHGGSCGNLFTQVVGRKKWWIYPHTNTYAMASTNQVGGFRYTLANPEVLDDPSFPLLKYAKGYEVTLEPGDVLWNPPFTWHYIVNQEDSVAAACKWISDWQNVGFAPAFTLIDLAMRLQDRVVGMKRTTYSQVKEMVEDRVIPKDK